MQNKVKDLVVTSDIPIEENTQMSRIDFPDAQIKSRPALLGEVDVRKVIQLLPGVQSGRKDLNVDYGEEPERDWKSYCRDLYAESADPLVEDYCVNFTARELLLAEEFIDGKGHRVKLTANIYNNYYDPEHYKEVR